MPEYKSPDRIKYHDRGFFTLDLRFMGSLRSRTNAVGLFTILKKWIESAESAK